MEWNRLFCTLGTEEPFFRLVVEIFVSAREEIPLRLLFDRAAGMITD
jgi:hypothetical protein